MFRFPYQKLLELYQSQEDIARRDYNESLYKLELEKGNLQNMYKLCDQSTEEIFNLQTQKEGAPLERLNQLDLFIEGQKVRIERQKVVIQNHIQIVEQKQEILHMAAKERKIIEKLKEKRHEEYKRELRKQDAKFTDEIVVTRFKGAYEK